MDKSKLLNEINNIMEKNAPQGATVSKFDRDILYYERELRENNIGLEVSKNIAELKPELSENIFGSGKFKRNEYELAWKSIDNKNTFRFVLTNIPYKNSKVLISCPDEFKRDVVKLLETFVVEMANEAKSKMEDRNQEEDPE